ncbi:hypothetical protein CU102_16030 [Phyllobacterium brassicacearum]|uniref:Uncharacterized protein n=1 Tax=Phyllobacterium brassicacearum TaxID=314235 RepID=A0A2P7BNM1_9HYPH|nr:hypothetical protein [Phyllobacterium brassicacearum]PSH68066.1 hypothetical protein CU102_16030 [Phyllobacterium brassicacearum]TDQ28332.1 hypothetical protein DEV91_110174 [Phyllobacterium brassicacearum]
MDKFQETSSEQLKELLALEKMRNNEIQKYTAAALDRLSTASAVVGVLGPIVNMVTNGVGLTSQLLTIVYSLVLSTALHVRGKIMLKVGLR